MQSHQYTYDLFVIGGGSGGLAAAKEAASLGAKVALADFVKPSPIGSKWGLGGTCVNVGCIPKKLMHLSAVVGESHEAQKNMGWSDIKDKYSHQWEPMVQRVQNHIKKLNWGYKVALAENEVKYFNSLATLFDKNTVELTDKKGEKTKITSKYILISVGGRPTFLDDIPNNRQLCITSDDIFSLQKPPGKTLIVGASYIALECAGFLAGFHYDVTVMVRSILLRGFDQEMANKIGEYMERHGVKFIRGTIPSDIKQEGEKKRVFWKDANGQTQSDVYDTIMLAIGRSSDTQNIGLEQLGIKTKPNGKIICNDDDTTSIEGVFAIGDCVDKRPELTPTAIKAGRLLVRRLFGGEKKFMNYHYIPTTVFTPLEYGTIGFSEEDAKVKFGDANIKVFYSIFKPLEWNYSDHRHDDKGYCKLIINSADNKRVVGFHYLGPNAGEVTQGFAIAFILKATKEHFDDIVGIHPTSAEEFTTLKFIKGEGEAKESGC
ncbi:thioredoxin and glutathione reductase family protein, putative [Ichthyophthirius multifiliis]|uniref:Thioredoxin reductase n=1 Tax=Ichthyophthirius multifiliis TaxID=5932 RepID=G0QZR1_ICHMU|nr:thioredoxin and glutathione reductase family protein, putative [Ichthyophthirius multifiliis]EGR29300.1 thioredoxin and glutathione reductase family protein, putative [Ichthyophthirius multifiliis]|eukprot:XP_004030536.1 thioredoxin and glutathione reductase family protein, putative [Ichthyophthirius multifiliis]